MKRVALLIAELNRGGAERVVSRLTKILSREYKVYLILFEDTYIEYEFSGELINLNIPSKSGITKILLPFKRARALKQVKKNLNLDYVISFLDSPNVANILSRTLHCKTGVSIRNYVPGDVNNSFLPKISNIAIRYLYQKADVVIPVSKVISQYLINNYSLPIDRLKVIYNPFDVDLIRNQALEQLEPQYERFFENSAIFVSVGRLMYQKGFWHLVKAFKVVHDKRPEVRLILIGNDYQKGKVQRLIEELSLGDKVLLTGQLDNPMKLMSRSDVYVLTSLYEGFPNSLVEAMACGCPIIAADCKSGPREILYEDPELDREAADIEMADYGVLVPPLDPDEDWDPSIFTAAESKLAEAMLLFLYDQDVRETYSKKALERAHSFSYDICRQKYREILG